MQKHILDRPKAPSQTAPSRLLAIKRNAIPRKASLILQRRPRTRIAMLRARNFLRVAQS